MWIILIISLLIISVYLSIKLKFKCYKINIKELLRKDKTSLFLTLGTKMGVGSIIGVTSSILIGGFSSVIWIIVFSILSSSLIYYESYYGNKYKKVNNSEYVGGPYFILRYGLNNKILSIISLILLILIYSFLFQMIQFNTISYILINKLFISKNIIIFISIIILLITINLSIKDILNIMNKIVPYMCLIFIMVSLYIIIKNVDYLSLNCFKNIFNYKSILSGLVIGIKRSIFATELLIGTTSTSSASDKNDIDTSIKYQILSSYFISIVITLLITFLLIIYINSNNIIISDYNLLIYNIFNSLLEGYGSYFLLIIYLLFGFTTILSGYYIGKNNIEYLTNNKIIINIFKIIFITLCILGIILKNNIIWKYIDIFIFIMIIINTYSIIKLVMYDDR